MAEWVVGHTQFTADVATSDVAKARMFGLAPYVEYLHYCFDDKIDNFDDLLKYMPTEVRTHDLTTNGSVCLIKFYSF